MNHRLTDLLDQIVTVSMARLQADAASQGGKFTRREREMLLAGITAGAATTFEVVSQYFPASAVPSAHDSGESAEGGDDSGTGGESGPGRSPDEAGA